MRKIEIALFRGWKWAFVQSKLAVKTVKRRKSSTKHRCEYTHLNAECVQRMIFPRSNLNPIWHTAEQHTAKTTKRKRNTKIRNATFGSESVFYSFAAAAAASAASSSSPPLRLQQHNDEWYTSARPTCNICALYTSRFTSRAFYKCMKYMRVSITSVFAKF